MAPVRLQNGRVLKNEHGISVVMATGIVTLMLLFAAFAVNAARYYSYRTQLNSLATEVASYAGNYLPNPKLAYEKAWEAFSVLKDDFRTSEADLLFPEGLYMKVSLNFINAEPYEYPTPQEVRVPIDTDENDQPEASWTQFTLMPPFKSINIEIGAPFDLNFLNFSQNVEGVASITVSSESSSQLAPTDVVLVIENSNSVISALEEEATDPTAALLDEGMSDIEDRKGLRSGDYGPLFNTVSKKIIHGRQCFGEVTRDIKRSALLAFDLLSSSATYRVGVIHTLNTTAGGEFPLETVRITSDSYKNVYKKLAFADPYPNPIIDVVDSNASYGSQFYPESRCATLTNEDAFPVPNHPLHDLIGAAPIWPNVDQYMWCGGNAPEKNDILVQEACPGIPRTFKHSIAELLPRDLIWINNAGVTGESGYPLPQYDHVNMQFAIKRAIDVLKNAPKREDSLPVRRRVVLVFTDGFEKPFTTETGHNPSVDGTEFTRTINSIKPPSATGPDALSGYELERASVSFAVDGTPTLNGIEEDYCKEGASNALITNTTHLDNTRGVKLGVFYYGFRGATAATDPFSVERFLPRHGTTDLTLNASKDLCKTPWVSNRGKFLLEATPAKFPDTGKGKNMHEQIIPKAVRALFVSEILE